MCSPPHLEAGIWRVFLRMLILPRGDSASYLAAPSSSGDSSYRMFKRDGEKSRVKCWVELLSWEEISRKAKPENKSCFFAAISTHAVNSSWTDAGGECQLRIMVSWRSFATRAMCHEIGRWCWSERGSIIQIRVQHSSPGRNGSLPLGALS